MLTAHDIRRATKRRPFYLDAVQNMGGRSSRAGRGRVDMHARVWLPGAPRPDRPDRPAAAEQAAQAAQVARPTKRRRQQRQQRPPPPPDDDPAIAIVRVLAGSYEARRYRVGDRYLVFLGRGAQQTQQQAGAAGRAFDLLRAAAESTPEGHRAVGYLQYVLTIPLDPDATRFHVALLLQRRGAGVAFAMLKLEVPDQRPFELDRQWQRFPGRVAEMSHLFVSTPREGLGRQILRLALDDARTRLGVAHVLVGDGFPAARGFYRREGAVFLSTNDEADMFVINTAPAAGAMDGAVPM